MQILMYALNVLRLSLMSMPEGTHTPVQFFIPFSLAPSYRLSGDIPRLLRRCVTANTGPSKYWKIFALMMVSLMPMMTFSVVAPISVPFVTVSLNQMTHSWWYLSMALNSLRARSPTVGFISGLILSCPWTIDTRRSTSFLVQSSPVPKKPKFIKSFLFPGFHHLSTLQHKGLKIWDSARNHEFLSQLMLYLACADGPGLLTMSNFIGHQGKNGCHMQWPLKAHCKPGASQYYPILLKPDNYHCKHFSMFHDKTL